MEKRYKEPRYRHEYKFLIDYPQYLYIRNRLKTVMKKDSHVNSEGFYQINSIYFDNCDDKALLEKTIGASYREKFRIRFYGEDFSLFLLEKKIKNENLTMKVDSIIPFKDVKSLLSGNIEFLKKSEETLFNELYSKMKIQGLKPRVLVSYKREPYVFPFGNVRVTFDYDIRSSLYSEKLLSNKDSIPVNDNNGFFILEVKYDDYIPDLIRNIVFEERLNVQSFSKYAASRRFG